MEIAEQELLEGVKNSDKSAFKEIYYKHQPILFRYVVYRVQNREVAEDIGDSARRYSRDKGKH